MRPEPAPKVPGNTEQERFDNALRIVLAVSKAEVLKKEARLKRARARKRAKKQS